jgi:hypothetical protein
LVFGRSPCATFYAFYIFIYIIQLIGEGLPVKTVHLLTLMRTVIKTAGDFWTKYECDEIFDIKYVTVDSNYARQNILTEMLCRSLSIARISGLKVREIFY